MTKDCAIIEIVEDGPHEPGPGTAGIIKPNEVRINGQPLWCPQGEAIKVHGMVFNDQLVPDGERLVAVTLTLFARRVFLGHASESPETPERRVQDAERRLAEAQTELAAAREAVSAA